MRYAYPYAIQPEPEGGLFISFPDLPEALTGAATEADVPRMARDALIAALSFYTDGERPLPAPSEGQPIASVPVLIALKLALHEAMLAHGISNVALAKRAGTDEKAIRRMRDLFQATKVENLEFVLGLLGRRAEISVLEDAA